MRNGERVEGRLKTLDEARERAGRAREPLPPKGTVAIGLDLDQVIVDGQRLCPLNGSAKMSSRV